MTEPDPRLVPLLDLLARLDDVTVVFTMANADGWALSIQTATCDCEVGHATPQGWLQLELLTHAAGVDGVVMEAVSTFPASNPGRELHHILRGPDNTTLDQVTEYLDHLLTEVYTIGGDA